MLTLEKYVGEITIDWPFLPFCPISRSKGVLRLRYYSICLPPFWVPDLLVCCGLLLLGD